MERGDYVLVEPIPGINMNKYGTVARVIEERNEYVLCWFFCKTTFNKFTSFWIIKDKCKTTYSTTS